jgi:hypothetical protein
MVLVAALPFVVVQRTPLRLGLFTTHSFGLEIGLLCGMVGVGEIVTLDASCPRRCRAPAIFLLLQASRRAGYMMGT